MDIIFRLVDNLDVLRAAWEREPFVSTGLGGFDDVFTVESAQRLVASGLPLPSVRLFRQGVALASERIARPRDPNARTRELFADIGKVARHVAEGATLVLEELQSYSPEVADFAAVLARETGYQTDCTAFLTPARSRGVGPHYDPISVFVRQVYGSKRWRIRTPVQRWPSRKWRPGDDVDTRQVLDVVLKEGECLYIPRGFVHVGDTTDVASVHLSISVSSVTWGTVLQNLLSTAAAESELLRETLPPAFANIDRTELFHGRLAELATYLEKLQWSDISPDPGLGGEAAGPKRDPDALRAALDTATLRRESP